MMRLLGLGLIFLGFLATPWEARAEVFENAETLRPGRFRFGFEPQVNFGGEEDFLGYAHFGFGATPTLDVDIIVGFLQSDTYIGADAEFALLPDGRGYPALSISGGAHFNYNDGRNNNGDPGLDFRFLASEGIGDRVSLYLGLDTNIEFRPNDVAFPVKGIIGVEVFMSRHLHLLFEFGIELQESQHHIAGGPLVLFP